MAEMDATRLVRGSTYLVTYKLVNTIIGAVALAFIARILTQAEMGVTVALVLTIRMAQALSDLGFGGGLTKYVAEYRGKEVDYTPISFGAVSVKALTASCAAVLCGFAAPWLSGFLLKSGEYVLVFQLLSIDILMVCLTHTLNCLLFGVNRIKEIAILSVALEFVGKTSAVAFLICGFGLGGLVIGWILGGLAYIVPCFLIIVRNKHVRIHPIRDVVPYLKMLARFSWPLFLTSVVVFLYNWFDQFILLAYVPLSDLAVYNVTDRAFTVLLLIPTAISSLLLPYYSEQFGKDEQQKIVAGVHGSSRYIALLYTPLAFGLMATANPAITLFAGSPYARGDITLAILCLFAAVNGVAASFGGLLLVYNRTATVLVINIASVGVSSLMSPVLLPLLGILGMAFIRGASVIISLVLSVIAINKHIQIKFDKDAVWKSWCAAIVMFVAVWLTESIHLSLYLLPLYVAIGGAVYMITLRLLRAVNANDMRLVRSLLGKRALVIANIVEKVLT